MYITSSSCLSFVLCHLSHVPPKYIMTFFFFNDPATTEIYTLSLHDALPICQEADGDLEQLRIFVARWWRNHKAALDRSEEHTSELQSPDHLVCRLLLEKKNKKKLNRDLSR